MRRTFVSSVVAVMALLLGTAASADAQGPDEGWWSWALPQVAEAARNGQVRGIPVELPGIPGGDPDARGRRGGGPENLPGRAERERDHEYEDERERAEEARERARERAEEERERARERAEDARERGAAHRGGHAERGAIGERQGHGPPFCRNGQGHPVHGWQWCVEKGWAGGGSHGVDPRVRRDGGWLPVVWQDVILEAPSPRRGEQRTTAPTLGDVLGDVILRRLGAHRDRIGATGDITARWLVENGARILQVRSGGSPLAEFTDLDADGRADAVLLSRGR